MQKSSKSIYNSFTQTIKSTMWTFLSLSTLGIGSLEERNWMDGMTSCNKMASLLMFLMSTGLP